MSKITINQEALRTSREWKRHQIKHGSNVFRILPPFGSVEEHNNYPYKKWSIAWLVDPKTGKRRPFASPLTDGEDACPVKEFQDSLRDFIETKKSNLQVEGLSSSEIREELKELYELQWNIKVQHLYAYNACDKSGTVGLLEIKPTAQKEMKKKMAEYISLYGQDPTSLSSTEDDSGVWFNVTKEGTGKDTRYYVDFNKDRFKDDRGRLVSVEDRSELPHNVVEKYDDMGYNLNTIYYKKSYNELKDILLYNLSVLSESMPYASQVPGFILDGDASTEVAASQPVPKGSKAVSLNLGDDDDEDDDDSASVNKTTNHVKPSSVDSDLDDIKNLADSILGD